MKTTLSTHDIAEALRRDSNAAWTYNGAVALAKHLEQDEADSGREMELDVVAIRCDFSEYSGLQDWASDYFGGAYKAIEFFCGDDENGAGKFNDGDCNDDIRNHILENGQLVEFSGGIIVSSF